MSSPHPARAPAVASPFRSFWMGGFEGADHVDGRGAALDLARATGHLSRLDEDYRQAAALGLCTIRESIGWRVSEPRPGRFELRRAERCARLARKHGLQVLWTLLHSGTPADLSLFDERLVERFAAFAAAVARAIGPLSDEPPVYNLVNEIESLARAACEVGSPGEWRTGRGSAGPALPGDEAVKRRLVRAVLAGIDSVRAVDPRARFLHVEPVVDLAAPQSLHGAWHAPNAQVALDARDTETPGCLWQVFDLIAGRLEPELGGRPDALDLVGLSCRSDPRVKVGTARRMLRHARDSRPQPISRLLVEAWQRYRRPLILSGTRRTRGGRAARLNDTAAEVFRAREAGVPVEGLCLDPLIDRPHRDDPTRWQRAGLWDVVPASGQRVLHSGYAKALARWQAAHPLIEAEPPEMPHLIVFSHLRWSYVYQRPQHLLSRLAKHYRVLFVEEPVHGEGPARLEQSSQGPNIDVLVPRTPVPAAGFHDDQLPSLEPLLVDYLREEGIDDYVLWFYTPMALPLASSLQPRAIVYDCMDELSAFRDAPRQLRQRETALLKVADAVFTGGPALYEAKRSRHPNVHCLPSAVDADHFSPACLVHDSEEALEADRLQSPIGRPRLGYFGVIDERVDLALLARIADERRDLHIVMAGPVAKIDPASLPRRPNIHWLGLQPYARLPYLVAKWDACLIPFAINASTRYISPTKTLEYLAAEKPVVSTPVQDVIALYGHLVRVAPDAERFIDACDEALIETGRERSRRLGETQATVSWFSWDQSAETVRQVIEEVLNRPQPALRARRRLRIGVPGLPGDAATGAKVPPVAVDAAGAPRHVRNLIVGAGPTGLAAACHLGCQGEGDETLLVEREERVGGWCRSIEDGGFTFDHAGHIMFSNDPFVLELYGKLLGENIHWQNREAWIYSKGVHTRYPFQGSLYGLPPAVLKECLIGAIEARFGPLGGKPGDAAAVAAPPSNFEEFIYRVWGAGIAKHFAIPYNRKLWATPLVEMETSWLGGRVPLPDLEQMIEGALAPSPQPMGPNARFGYPLRGGFQALMDGFLPLLDCELSLGTAVVRISPAERRLWLDDGRSVVYDTLLSTMPLPRLVQACGEDVPHRVREAAAALRHVSVRCVNLGVARENLSDKHWIYYPEDTVFHRIFMQGNASPHNNPPGGFGLTCEISYGPDKPLESDGDALIARVIEDCRRVGVLRADDRVLVANQIDMPCAYVVYDHGRAARVALIRDWLDSFGIVLAGRYAEWEYYNSDHAFLAGKKAAERILQVRAGPGGANHPTAAGLQDAGAGAAPRVAAVSAGPHA